MQLLENLIYTSMLPNMLAVASVAPSLRSRSKSPAVEPARSCCGLCRIAFSEAKAIQKPAAQFCLAISDLRPQCLPWPLPCASPPRHRVQPLQSPFSWHSARPLPALPSRLCLHDSQHLLRLWRSRHQMKGMLHAVSYVDFLPKPHPSPQLLSSQLQCRHSTEET